MDTVDRIRALCQKNGMSITKLEVALGYGNGSISKAGTNAMRSDRLMAIANFFGVTMEYLMTGKDWEWEAATPAEIERFEKDAATPYPITDQDRELLDMLRELNQDGQQKALEYIKDLYDTGKYKKDVTDSQSLREA